MRRDFVVGSRLASADTAAVGTDRAVADTGPVMADIGLAVVDTGPVIAGIGLAVADTGSVIGLAAAGTILVAVSTGLAAADTVQAVEDIVLTLVVEDTNLAVADTVTGGTVLATVRIDQARVVTTGLELASRTAKAGSVIQVEH